MFSALQIPNLPTSSNLKPFLEIRERYERRTDRDFVPQIDDNRSDALTRILIGVDGKRGDLKYSLRYRYADDVAWTLQRNFSEERSDLDSAFIVGKTKTTHWTIGRQKLSKGQQRLLSHVEWSNIGISWDGIRIQQPRFDAFVAHLAFHPVPSKNAWIAGAGWTDSKGETLLLANYDRKTTLSRDLITLDRTYEQGLAGIKVSAEVALQTGRSEGRELDAWAGHLRITKPWKKLSAYAEGNAASGGQSPRHFATFDNLYPANHYKYGLINMQGWRNMQEIALGLELAPAPKVTVNAEFHRTWLQNAKDAWYSSSGPANRFTGGMYQDPSGARGRSLGQEWDLFGNYRPDETRLFLAGVSMFVPGSFIGAFHPTGTRIQYWFTMAATLRF